MSIGSRFFKLYPGLKIATVYRDTVMNAQFNFCKAGAACSLCSHAAELIPLFSFFVTVVTKADYYSRRSLCSAADRLPQLVSEIRAVLELPVIT